MVRNVWPPIFAYLHVASSPVGSPRNWPGSADLRNKLLRKIGWLGSFDRPRSPTIQTSSLTTVTAHHSIQSVELDLVLLVQRVKVQCVWLGLHCGNLIFTDVCGGLSRIRKSLACRTAIRLTAFDQANPTCISRLTLPSNFSFQSHCWVDLFRRTDSGRAIVHSVVLIVDHCNFGATIFRTRPHSVWHFYLISNHLLLMLQLAPLIWKSAAFLSARSRLRLN